MHFKLGLYEHQSAGALQGLVNLLSAQPQLLARKDGGAIARITIVAYEPAYGIIGARARASRVRAPHTQPVAAPAASDTQAAPAHARRHTHEAGSRQGGSLYSASLASV